MLRSESGLEFKWLIDRPDRLANQRPVFLAVNYLNSYTDSDLRKKQTLKTPPHNVFGEPKTVADTKLEFLIEYAG